MSGHSKWSQIKRQKGANDAKRGALFTKLTREIITAARQGGGDVDGNYRLRMAVDNARSNSMPAENIKRAIERATGSGADAEQYEEITYEGFGPSNVAVIVATMTDNRNRTAVRDPIDLHQVRRLPDAGGLAVRAARHHQRAAERAGPGRGHAGRHRRRRHADVGIAGGRRHPGHHRAVRPGARCARPWPRRATRPTRPSCRWSRPPASRSATRRRARGVLTFVERLEDLDDVQNVYANFDIPDALMEQLEASVA